MSVNWKDDNDIFGRMLVLTNNHSHGLRNAVDNFDADFNRCSKLGTTEKQKMVSPTL